MDSKLCLSLSRNWAMAYLWAFPGVSHSHPVVTPKFGPTRTPCAEQCGLRASHEAALFEVFWAKKLTHFSMTIYHASRYGKPETYVGPDFFKYWNFYTGPDPTHGTAWSSKKLDTSMVVLHIGPRWNLSRSGRAGRTNCLMHQRRKKSGSFKLFFSHVLGLMWDDVRSKLKRFLFLGRFCFLSFFAFAFLYFPASLLFCFSACFSFFFSSLLFCFSVLCFHWLSMDFALLLFRVSASFFLRGFLPTVISVTKNFILRLCYPVFFFLKLCFCFVVFAGKLLFMPAILKRCSPWVWKFENNKESHRIELQNAVNTVGNKSSQLPNAGDSIQNRRRPPKATTNFDNEQQCKGNAKKPCKPYESLTTKPA